MRAVRNPHYTSDNRIDCEKLVEGLGWIPFTASPDDPSEAGRDLYARLQAGEFGDIAPYVAPPAPAYEALLARAHAQRRAAYASESDPIKNEAEYDALVNGTEPDYTAWLAAVAAIKARYPLPVE